MLSAQQLSGGGGGRGLPNQLEAVTHGTSYNLAGLKSQPAVPSVLWQLKAQVRNNLRKRIHKPSGGWVAC